MRCLPYQTPASIVKLFRQYEDGTLYYTYGYYVIGRSDLEGRNSTYEYNHTTYNDFFYYNFGAAIRRSLQK